MEKEEQQEKSIFSPQELAKKYNIDLKKLEEEQKKLAKNLILKDNIDFSLADKIGAVDNTFFKNKIISAAIIISQDLEILFQEYYSDNLKFPYIPGFRSYRELPTMVDAFNKLEEKPDIVFIHGHGIAHPRLGLASHFSLVTGVPTIGVADSLLPGIDIKNDDIILDGKKVGRVLQSKENSKPLYISPGGLISIKTAYELSKKLIKEPHKFPEPLHLAHKYCKSTRDELFQENKPNKEEIENIEN